MKLATFNHAHQKAFAITGNFIPEQLGRLRQWVIQAIAKGLTFEEFKAQLEANEPDDTYWQTHPVPEGWAVRSMSDSRSSRLKRLLRPFRRYYQAVVSHLPGF